MNLGLGKKYKVKDVINIILRELGNKKIKIIKKNSFSEDTWGSYANNYKLISEGWKPQYDLITGARRTIYEIEKKNLITAVLTGKGGSKLKDKNILKFFGRPLLSYPCKAAKKVNLIDNFFVSSENKKILQTANKYGYTKIVRPSKLSKKILYIKMY